MGKTTAAILFVALTYVVTAGLSSTACAAVGLPEQQLPEQQLPEQQLNDANTKISFNVDTTWHTVEGKTSQVSGRLWETTPGDDSSIRAEIKIPVASFDTDSSSRDKELRSSMAAEQYPHVVVKILGIDPSCRPSTLNGASCTGKMRAELTIRDVTKPLELTYQLSKPANGATGTSEVTGEVSFEWLAFHVKDPSILIARVHKDVQVKFSCLVENLHR